MVAPLGRVHERQPRRRDPYLRHPELHHDRAVSVWRGGDDSAAHFAQRHLVLQRDANAGGGPGGVWLEAGARRRVQTTPITHAALRASWLRDPDLGDGHMHNALRLVWSYLSCQSRRPVERAALSLCVHGVVCGILLGESVQAFQRQDVEAEHHSYCHDVSGYHGHHLLGHQQLRSFLRVIHCGSVHDASCVDDLVVRRVHSIGVRGVLLRLQEGNHHHSRANQPNRQTHPRPGLVHEPRLQHRLGWHSALRCGLH
mmetsp:Transcript_8582/g.12808  ORF Transcript_8582/g.12808 Transcript_8582/m.12808 type:complete len:256 (+) Transcript_8582:879-1646(+)